MNAPAAKTRSWPNLEDAYRIKLRVVMLADKRRFYVLIGEPDAITAIEDKPAELGFSKNTGGVWVRDAAVSNGKLEMAQLIRVFPKVTFRQMTDREITQVGGAARATSQEKQQSAALAAAQPVGLNDLGESVFEGSNGRFVRRADDSVVIEVATDPARFLRAVDGAALQRVTDGLIVDIAEFGRKLDQKAFRRFAAAIWDEARAANAADLRGLQEALESAAVRYIGRCKDDATAYIAATAIDEGMPSQLARTAASVELQQFSTPLPIALAVQRVLGDLSGKSVHEPTAGNGSLVSRAFASGASRLVATELAPARAQALRALFAKQIADGVADVREGDTLVLPMPETDVVVANPPFGSLKRVQFYLDPDEDSILAEPLRLQRLDFQIALATLEARKKDGLTALIVGGDAPIHTGGKGGEILAGSRYFLDFIADRYHLHECIEVDGRLYAKMGAEYPVRIVVIGSKRPEPDHSAEKVPQQIPVLRSYAELEDWANAAQVRVHDARKALEAVLTGSIDDISASFDAGLVEDDVELDASVRFENPYQSPYVPMSRTGEAETMIPRYLVGPQNVAFERLKLITGGDVDGWVADKLDYRRELLPTLFSPEQIDALALCIARLDRNQGFLNSDKTGVGKGRFMAAMCRYAILQGKVPIFVTEKENLFSDLQRDFNGIQSAALIKPLIVNSASEMRDLDTNAVVHRSPPSSTLGVLARALAPEDAGEGHNVVAERLKELGFNLVVCTYSQVAAGFNGKSRKAQLIAALAAGNYLLLDESHNAASLDSNTSHVIDIAATNAQGIVYASATFAKGAANMGAYSRLFAREAGGSAINVESLGAVLAKGGESLLEAVTSMLVQDGAMVRRELDMSQVEFLVEAPSPDALARNEATAEAFATAISRMAYYGGDVNRIVRSVNRERKAAAKAAADAAEAAGDKLPDNARRGQRLGVSGTNFGSRLYTLQRQLLLMLSADQAATSTIRALKEGRKPVAVVEQTMQSLVEEMAEMQLVAGELLAGFGESDASRPLRVGVDRIPMPTPTLRDVLLRTLKRMQFVMDSGPYGSPRMRPVTGLVKDPEEQELLERYVAVTIEAIMLLPDLPAAPIDIFRARLQQAGYNMGEISGRSTYLADPTGEQPALAVRTDERLKTIFEFNNGTIDAALITRAGMTGLSMHASSTFVDQRQREMVEIQIPNNVAERVQAFGRVNRKGQVSAPIVRTVSTGLPGEARLLAMQNAKLAKLSAATTSNRSDKARMEEVPDLLNWVGEKVAVRYLQDNSDIAKMLDIDLGFEGGGENFFVNRLLSRLCMMPTVAQQREVIADLDREFVSVVRELEACGRNPFEIAEHDWRARLLDRQVFLGAETPTYESEFDRPVYVDTVEYEVRREPMTYDAIADRLSASREALIEAARVEVDLANEDLREQALRRADGSAERAKVLLEIARAEDAKNLEVSEAVAEQIGDAHTALRALLTRGVMAIEQLIEEFLLENDEFPSFAHALEDPRCHQARTLNSKRETLNYLANSALNAGASLAAVSGTPGQGQVLDQRLLILSVKPPRAGKEHLFGHWEFRVLPIGGSVKAIRGVSLSQLASQYEATKAGTGLGLRYESPREIQEAIAAAGQGVVMERRKVLSGNLYMATEYAVEHGMGTPGVYTDANGVRQRAVVLPLSVTNALESQYIKVPNNNVAVLVAARAVEARQGVTFVHTSKPDWERGRVVAVIVSPDATVRIQCPGSRQRGGSVYLDSRLRSVVSNYEGEDFSGNRERMTSVAFPIERLADAFEALSDKGFTFYVEAKFREAVNQGMMEERMASVKRRQKGTPLGKTLDPDRDLDAGSIADRSYVL